MRNAVSVLTFVACFAVPGLAHAQAVADPWEGFNRRMFAVHEAVDQAVLEPVARGYRAVTPQPVRTGVQNFLRNLKAPVIFINDVLQGEIGRAGTTAARFGVNTTIGVAGVLDPATNMGLERHDEDFGQTLAVWGLDAGPYIFVPILGPTTLRDGVGQVVDVGFDPLTYSTGEDADEARIGRGVLSGLSAREQLLDTVDDIRTTSVDPYATIRSSYGLLRQSAIQNGRSDVQDLPEFDVVPEEEQQEPAPGGGEPSASLSPASKPTTLAHLTLEKLTGDVE